MQVIEVPKLSHDSIPQRSAVRRPQNAEQLVEVPTEPGYLLAVLASKFCSRREIRGILSGQGSTASSSRSHAAKVAFDGVFRTFPGVKKVRGPPASAEITRQVIIHLAGSSRTPAHGVRRLMAMALCLVRTMARGDFFQDGDEEEEEEELEMFDESIDRFELSGWRPRRLCCDYMAGCCARGWGCTFAHGEQEVIPSWSTSWTCQCCRSRMKWTRR